MSSSTILSRLFGQKPAKPVRPDDPSNRIDPFVYDNNSSPIWPQQDPVSRRVSSPPWDEDLPPIIPSRLSPPPWDDDMPMIPPPRQELTLGDDLWSVIGDSGASEAGTTAGPSRRPNPTALYDLPRSIQPTIAPYNLTLNPIVKDPLFQSGPMGRSPTDPRHREPVDWTIAEKTGNEPEDSIHSQKEKIWSRNLFRITGNNKETNEDLMRMMGFITATASDDWSLILEVCERASSNESTAKEASRVLRREFKYAEPPAQLSAARLWAIMLQNSTDIFIAQTASKQFLDNLGGVINNESTSPVVRERLLEILASAAYHYGKKPGKEGFMSLWRKVRPSWKPIEGIPFDLEDPMFAPSVPRKSPAPRETSTPVQAPNPRQSQLQASRLPLPPNVPSRRERGIIPPEEDIRRLFEECEIAKGNSKILSQALAFATPSTLDTDAVIREFHTKCHASQELVVAQIPWATAMAEKARQKNGNISGGSESTEERLLKALLGANEELIEVLTAYDEVEKMAHIEKEEKESASRTRIDREQIHLSSGGLPLASRHAVSSLSRSQASSQPVNEETNPPAPTYTQNPMWLTAEEEKRRLLAWQKAKEATEIDNSATLATETTAPPAYTSYPAYIYNESTKRISAESSEGRNPAPQSAGVTSANASIPSANEKANAPAPAYDSLIAMRMASAPPTRKTNENISNSAETTSVVLNPYTFTSSSKLKGADLYKSAVNNNAKSISPPSNSRPSAIAPSPLVETPIKETNIGLSPEKENSKKTESKTDSQPLEVVSQGSASKVNNSLSKNYTVIGGEPPFEFRPDAQYADPNAHLWAQYYAKGGTDPTGAVYFLSVPGIKEVAPLNEFNAPKHSAESTQDSEEEASHLPAESIHTADGFPELEKLMQEKVPLDLTGEVTVADYRKPKHGGFALVYKGVWKGKEVAVKVLKATKNSKRPAPWEGSMQRRLTREINVWAAISHRNIVEFLGFAEDFADFPAMISTWCNPGTARDYLEDNEDMAVEIRIRLVQDVADGIEYLHSLKVIHGDLKPANILIDDNYVARLCDFGLVRLDDWQGPAGMTTTSPYTGTERYKAPELFITMGNSHPIATSEGDIWALGCIALEFIDTRLPYERYHHSIGLAKAIADGEPPASQPKSSDSLFSQHFWYLLEACWSWYPENRFNASQIVEELAQLSELQSRTAQT